MVETITRHAYRTTDEQVLGLREHGWSDPQIAADARRRTDQFLTQKVLDG